MSMGWCMRESWTEQKPGIELEHSKLNTCQQWQTDSVVLSMMCVLEIFL